MVCSFNVRRRAGGCRVELAGEKLDLVAHQCFEGLVNVEVEMTGVVAFDLAARRGARISDRLGGRRDGVAVADAEQDWEVDLLRRAPGPVGDDRRSDPGRYLIPKRRVGRQQ